MLKRPASVSNAVQCLIGTLLSVLFPCPHLFLLAICSQLPIFSRPAVMNLLSAEVVTERTPFSPSLDIIISPRIGLQPSMLVMFTGHCILCHQMSNTHLWCFMGVKLMVMGQIKAHVMLMTDSFVQFNFFNLIWWVIQSLAAIVNRPCLLLDSCSCCAVVNASRCSIVSRWQAQPWTDWGSNSEINPGEQSLRELGPCIMQWGKRASLSNDMLLYCWQWLRQRGHAVYIKETIQGLKLSKPIMLWFHFHFNSPYTNRDTTHSLCISLVFL